jgi:hypothetical protein
MSMNSPDRRIRIANLVLAAIGLTGIAFTVGGWAAAPGDSPVAGIAIEDRTGRLFRVHEDGAIFTLNLTAGQTSSGTSATWQLFKAP